MFASQFLLLETSTNNKSDISRNYEDARTISSTSHKVSHCVRAETANSSLVPWPLNKSEAGVELILIETFLFFGCHESLSRRIQQPSS